jgi:cell division protein FtsX
MCHTLLRVKFNASKEVEIKTAKDERELNVIIDELKAKPNVSEIQFFPQSHALVLTQEWKKREFVAETTT